MAGAVGSIAKGTRRTLDVDWWFGQHHEGENKSKVSEAAPVCRASIAGAALGIDLPVCACVLDGGEMAILGEKCQIGGGLALRVNVIGHLAGGKVSAPDAYGFSTLGASDG